MHVAPPGIPGVRLRYIAARSYALLGDPSSVAGVLEQARRDQDAPNGTRSPCDEIGGEFAFGRARAEACAAAAWLDLGRGQEAKQSAELALSDLRRFRPAVSPSRRSPAPASTSRPHA